MNQEKHWEYTIREWSKEPLSSMLDLPEIRVLYDIGANVGGFSHILLQRFPRLRVYAWEPVKDNFDALKRNCPLVTAFQKGIYYGKTEARPMWAGKNVGGISIEQFDFKEPMRHRGDEVLQLNELEFFNLEKPDLIKIDVEGAEANIIEHSTIVKECPYLIIEWHLNSNPLEFFKRHLNHKVLKHFKEQFLLNDTKDSTFSVGGTT
jgi:FkbM family methyltransferase